jgi:hypothetical protein
LTERTVPPLTKASAPPPKSLSPIASNRPAFSRRSSASVRSTLPAIVPVAVVRTVAGPPSARTSRPSPAWTRPRMVTLLVVAEVTTMASESSPLTATALASTATKPARLSAKMPGLSAPEVATVPVLVTSTSPGAE